MSAGLSAQQKCHTKPRPDHKSTDMSPVADVVFELKDHRKQVVIANPEDQQPESVHSKQLVEASPPRQNPHSNPGDHVDSLDWEQHEIHSGEAHDCARCAQTRMEHPIHLHELTHEPRSDREE